MPRLPDTNRGRVARKRGAMVRMRIADGTILKEMFTSRLELVSEQAASIGTVLAGRPARPAWHVMERRGKLTIFPRPLRVGMRRRRLRRDRHGRRPSPRTETQGVGFGRANSCCD